MIIYTIYVILKQLLKETQTHNGVVRSWSGHERLPRCSLRLLLTRFLDLTTPPSPAILQYLSSCCTDDVDKDKLQSLASVSIRNIIFNLV